MEVIEPEAGKFCIPPKHYAVTQMECNSLKKAVTIRPDEVFKRENPSM